MSTNIKIARKSLTEFLVSPEIAAQTDNLQLRTLVWPHPLVPNNGFIDPAHDEELLTLAIQRLKQFDFVGVIEEGSLEDELSNWIGCEVRLPIKNPGRPLPDECRPDFFSEISTASVLLAARSRLDTALWKAVLSPGINADEFHTVNVLSCLAHVGSSLR